MTIKHTSTLFSEKPIIQSPPARALQWRQHWEYVVRQQGGREDHRCEYRNHVDGDGLLSRLIHDAASWL